MYCFAQSLGLSRKYLTIWTVLLLFPPPQPQIAMSVTTNTPVAGNNFLRPSMSAAQLFDIVA